ARPGPHPGGFGLEAGPVSGIAQERVSDMGEMHPDLMGASRLKGTGDETRDRLPVGPMKTFQHLPVSDGPTSTLPYRLLFPGMGMAPDRGLDRALRAVRYPPDQGKVSAFERSFGLLRELLRERSVRLVGLGDDHEAGRVLVETVHNARPLDAA